MSEAVLPSTSSGQATALRRTYGPAARRPTPPSLSVRGVLRQMWHDLFGSKDVQDSPTLTYTWCADQFGHFNIGLGGTLFSALLVAGIRSLAGAPAWSPQWVATVCGAVLMAAFVAKEAYDFRVARYNARARVFAFNAREVLLNCGVACLYTLFGTVVCVAAFWHLLAGVAAFGIALLLHFPVSFWWLRRKIAFQQADLPYLYRLPNFPANFVEPEHDVALLGEFARHDGQPGFQHVIIDGVLGSGRSSLAVGIATDYAFSLGIGRYISMVKLNQTGVKRDRSVAKAGRQPETEFSDGRTLWPLGAIDLLVVDDLDLGLAQHDPAQAIDPRVVEQALDTGPGRAFFARFHGTGRRTLWVAGSSDHIDTWHQVVADLVAGGDAAQVRVVRLKGPIAEALPHP